MKENLTTIMEQFLPEQSLCFVKPKGNGHINTTFLVEMVSGERYIIQKINTAVFGDPDDLMENIMRVTSFLREKLRKAGGDAERGTLMVIRGTNGKAYVTDGQGSAWRLYACVRNVVSFEKAQNADQMYQAGLAVGRFGMLLADFPAAELHETIPDFHNTPKRYLNLVEKAFQEDRYGRAAEVAEEIAFARKHREETAIFEDLHRRGKLPLRVTHNDTKIGNILFDADTHEAVCLCDLDTVMPGFAPFDFGDSIRSGAATAAEDGADLEDMAKVEEESNETTTVTAEDAASRARLAAAEEPNAINPKSAKGNPGGMALSLDYYHAYRKGYYEGTQGKLTETEYRLLPMGAKLMTLECGMRFLTDYLEGDVYFKTDRERQNLDRCRAQFALVEDMERKWGEMCADARNYWRDSNL
ncbi:MAG: aminoglycoside phosphotransferase family protein [Lachnospiraceae bacterium]|nr:aminoglycoside phosphotransferase family protein [Lachnospiraceae bacterium]